MQRPLTDRWWSVRTSSLYSRRGASTLASRDGSVAVAAADCGRTGSGKADAAGGAKRVEDRVDIAVALAGHEWRRRE